MAPMGEWRLGVGDRSAPIRLDREARAIVVRAFELRGGAYDREIARDRLQIVSLRMPRAIVRNTFG